MSFFVFDTAGDYDQGSLDGHLNYLRAYGGTPQGEEFQHLLDAVEMARDWATHGEPQVVTDVEFKIIDTVEIT
jgi:hypothetical protein